MNTILVIKHVEIEGPGSLGSFLSCGPREIRTIELAKGQRFPDALDGIDAVVCMGGPMNVYEEAKFPFLKKENAFIKSVVKDGIPFLGICLGAQLLSKACGGEVYKAPQKELGWSEVSLTAGGAIDLLFKGTPRLISVFQWHEDTFSIPPGGTLLAASAVCENQAFRVGANAYGLQFHVEVTPELIASWVNDEQKPLTIYDRWPEYEKQAAGIYGNLEKIIKKEGV